MANGRDSNPRPLRDRQVFNRLNYCSTEDCCNHRIYAPAYYLILMPGSLYYSHGGDPTLPSALRRFT